MKYTIPILLILIVVAFFFGRSCDQDSNVRTNTDSLERLRDKSLFKAREAEWQAALTKAMYKAQDTIREDAKIKWLAAKTITVPAICDTVKERLVNACDSLHKQDSIGIALRDRTIERQDTSLHYWHNTHANDSTLVEGLKNDNKVLSKELKKQKRKTFWANVRAALVGGAWVAREVISK